MRHDCGTGRRASGLSDLGTAAGWRLGCPATVSPLPRPPDASLGLVTGRGQCGLALQARIHLEVAAWHLPCADHTGMWLWWGRGCQAPLWGHHAPLRGAAVLLLAENATSEEWDLMKRIWSAFMLWKGSLNRVPWSSISISPRRSGQMYLFWDFFFFSFLPQPTSLSWEFKVPAELLDWWIVSGLRLAGQGEAVWILCDRYRRRMALLQCCIKMEIHPQAPYLFVKQFANCLYLILRVHLPTWKSTIFPLLIHS